MKHESGWRSLKKGEFPMVGDEWKIRSCSFWTPVPANLIYPVGHYMLSGIFYRRRITTEQPKSL